jgi:galactokinase
MASDVSHAAGGKVHEIFVPGRLSILGEHSDWASSYRSVNPAVSVGRCLVCVTNEGLFARASTSTTPGISYTCIDREGLELSFTHSYDLDALHAVARGGGFFAYVAGTVAAIIEAYDLTGGVSTPAEESHKFGIHINNYKSTLPMKKGLSSSAAVCVLVVTCFAALNGWELDQDEIMALAYKGEKKTLCCSSAPLHNAIASLCATRSTAFFSTY